MGWFDKKSDTCPHGAEGSCARCVMGDITSGVELYTELDEDLVIDCLAPFPLYLNERMRENGKEMVLAGGYIRDTLLGVTPKDVDIFGTKATCQDVATALTPGDIDTPMVIRKNSLTLEIGTRTYQFIHKFKFSGPEQLLDQFDYSIARAGIWYDRSGKKWTGTCWNSWEEDALAKRLLFLDKTPELESIVRLLSFTRRGYSVDSLSLSRILTSALASIKAGKEFDLDDIEADFLKGLEKMKDKAQIVSTPFKKSKPVDNDWGGS